MDDKTHLDEMCSRIAALRQEMEGVRGKAAFAKRLGLSASTYDNYENGRAVPADVLVRIAEVSGVDLRWLITGQSPESAVAASHPVIQRAAAMLSRSPRAAEPLAAFVDLLSAAMAFPVKKSAESSTLGPGTPDPGMPRSGGLSQSGRDSHGREQGGRVWSPLSSVSPMVPPGAAASSPITASPPASPVVFPTSPAVAAAVAEIQAAFQGQVAQSRWAAENRGPAENRGSSDALSDDRADVQSGVPAGGRVFALSGRQGREGWIPVLGRSAAGVASFWEAGESAGVTQLGALIARHVGEVSLQDATRLGVRHQRVRVELADAVAGEGGPADDVRIVSLRTPDGDVAEFVESPSFTARYADAFALRIDGLSMHPDISHGDVVLLSPSMEAVDGKAAVVQLADQIGVTCKLWRREGGKVHLIPVNDQMPPQTFPVSAVVWALRVLAKIKPA